MARTKSAEVWALWRDRLRQYLSSDLTVAAFCDWEGVVAVQSAQREAGAKLDAFWGIDVMGRGGLRSRRNSCLRTIAVTADGASCDAGLRVRFCSYGPCGDPEPHREEIAHFRCSCQGFPDESRTSTIHLREADEESRESDYRSLFPHHLPECCCRTTLQTPATILVRVDSASRPPGTFAASAPRKIRSRQSPCRATAQ